MDQQHGKEGPEVSPDPDSEERQMATLARLAAASYETLANDFRNTIASLRSQILRYETAIDNFSQGACFFDADHRLILCNRRYAEMYRLSRDQVRPGVTLREITEFRFAAGTCPMSTDEYVSWRHSVISASAPTTWDAELQDGRTIHVCHQPMPDGGWVATHEDITAIEAERIVARERGSLQALIDKVPTSYGSKTPIAASSSRTRQRPLNTDRLPPPTSSEKPISTSTTPT